MSVSPGTDLNADTCNSSAREEPEGDTTHMLNSTSHTKENELALKTLAKSVFELQRTEDSGDPTVSDLSHSKKVSFHFSWQEILNS